MKKTPPSTTPEPVAEKPKDIPYGRAVAVPAAPFTPPPVFVKKKPKWS